MNSSRNALFPGHQIHWYVISKILGQGGFGITYLAEDTNLGRDVAIKEYLPTGMAVREGDASVHPITGEQGEQYRWGLDRFISEAQTLARFKHPNIIQVYSVFGENNTAYMVMEYEQGHGLDRILKEQKTLPEAELLNILLPLLNGLEQVHAFGFIHRDIKPANIFIRDDGSPVLLDFGSARQSLGEHTQTLTAMVSPGYAPFEQYTSKGHKQGPWTDIYGLGATLYRAVTGRSPPNAMDRSEALLQTSRDIYVPASEINPTGYSPSLLKAIDAAMQFNTDPRPQSVSTWRSFLTDKSTRAVTTIDVQPEAQSTATEKTDMNTNVSAPPVVRPASESQQASGFGWRAVMITITLLLMILITARVMNRATPVSNLPPSHTEPITLNEMTEDVLDFDVDELLDEGTANETGDAVDDANETRPADVAATAVPASTGTGDQTDDLNPQEPDRVPLQTSQPARRVESLIQRLRQNPNDAGANRELRAMFGQYQQRIREAVRNKNYDQAEHYLEDMLRIAPNNQKLRDSLEKIRAVQSRQGAADTR